MNKLWHVIGYEYRRNTFNKGFLAICFSIPLLMTLSIGISFLIERSKNNNDPIGYVDESGFLQNALPVETLAGGANDPRQLVEIRTFTSQTDARQALDRGEIQAYYWLPQDFTETRHVQLFYNKEPGKNAMLEFWDFIQLQQVSDLPEDIAFRAVDGWDVITRTPDSALEVSGQNILSAFIPLIIAFFFYIIVMANSQMMLEAVAKEKENRTMEVIITSIPAGRLIAGKLVGIFITLLTMVFIWVSMGALGIFIGGHFLGMEALQNISLQPETIWPLVLLMVPALMVVNGLVVALGASVVEVQEGQGAAVLVAMLFYFPIALIVPITQNPESAFSIILSLIPFSAPFTTALRLMVIDVPWWQIGVSVGLLLLMAIFSVWLAQQAFRLGMLQYGKKLSFRQIFGRAEKQQPERRVR